MTIWNNCPITKSNSKILAMYDVDSKNPHDGIDISANNVYSICNGVVLHIGREFNTSKYEITVQYNSQICVRYCNLSSVNVKVRIGQTVMGGDLLGHSEDFVHFEYVTKSADGSKYPVRAGKCTYYKHDPKILLEGKVVLPKTNHSNIVIIHGDENFDSITFTEAMSAEFNGDNRGEPYVQL